MYVYVENDDVSTAGWSHAVAAVASIHHSQRLFVAARAPNEIFNLRKLLRYNWLSVQNGEKSSRLDHPPYFDEAPRGLARG